MGRAQNIKALEYIKKPVLLIPCEDLLNGFKQVTNNMLRFVVKEGNGNTEIRNKSTFGEVI